MVTELERADAALRSTIFLLPKCHRIENRTHILTCINLYGWATVPTGNKFWR